MLDCVYANTCFDASRDPKRNTWTISVCVIMTQVGIIFCPRMMNIGNNVQIQLSFLSMNLAFIIFI